MTSALRRYLGDPVATWRTGSPQSQRITLAALLLGVGACFALSLVSYALMPLTAYFVWLLVGMVLLRFTYLLLLSSTTVGLAVLALVVSVPVNLTRVTAMLSLLLAMAIVLFVSSRQQSGLPGPLSEAMLADLKSRLESQGRIPELPEGWRSESAMLAASGVGYGGDFLVSQRDDDRGTLELILVDVCGKGVGAAAQALQFGGALGGLIGNLPPDGLFAAANDFLLRQQSEELFATAVHVLVDLETGGFHLTSAGHPPALVWSQRDQAWVTDEARGTALGIVPRPEMHATEGVLEPGDALLFYTDGVVESHSTDLDTGIRWLQQAATEAVFPGFPGAPRRIISQVERGDDDRAVLVLHREPVGAPAGVPVEDSRPRSL